jgi:hypothetical protein
MPSTKDGPVSAGTTFRRLIGYPYMTWIKGFIDARRHDYSHSAALGLHIQEAKLTAHYHAVIWIDHHEARVFHFNADQADETVVHATHSPPHLHSKAGSASGTHVTDEPEFYRNVAGAVADAQAILVAGPSSAKTEFVKYLHKHASGTSKHVSGIETLPNLTDKQLLAEARRYFSQADRMRPQKG